MGGRVGGRDRSVCSDPSRRRDDLDQHDIEWLAHRRCELHQRLGHDTVGAR